MGTEGYHRKSGRLGSKSVTGHVARRDSNLSGYGVYQALIHRASIDDLVRETAVLPD
jgi:hypothetical protein